MDRKVYAQMTSPSQVYSSVPRENWWRCLRGDTCKCADFDDGGIYCTCKECIRKEELNEV